MTITGASPLSKSFLRSRAKQLMTDSCVVARPGDSRVVYDPVTKKATTQEAAEIYTGPCRLWEVPASGPIQYQGDQIVVSRLYLSIPYDAPGIEPEDQAKITKSDDPTLVGRYVQVISVFRGGGLRGARRMLVQMIDSTRVDW